MGYRKRWVHRKKGNIEGREKGGGRESLKGDYSVEQTQKEIIKGRFEKGVTERRLTM